MASYTDERREVKTQGVDEFLRVQVPPLLTPDKPRSGVSIFQAL